MAEFAFLAYYKDHPSDIAMAVKNRTAYEKLPKRQRGASMCATTLSPVMEDEALEVQKKAKRRFSLDFLFSKKKKQPVSKENAKRGSVDSATSTESADNVAINPGYNRRKSSEKVSDFTAYCFS